MGAEERSERQNERAALDSADGNDRDAGSDRLLAVHVDVLDDQHHLSGDRRHGERGREARDSHAGGEIAQYVFDPGEGELHVRLQAAFVGTVHDCVNPGHPQLLPGIGVSGG